MRLILDLIEFTELEDIPAVIISIDYEKCFDRLEWSAVCGALKYFNFGPNFISWVKLLYFVILVLKAVHQTMATPRSGSNPLEVLGKVAL